MRILTVTKPDGTTFDVDVDDVVSTAQKCAGATIKTSHGGVLGGGVLIGHEVGGRGRYIIRCSGKWLDVGFIGTPATNVAKAAWTISPPPRATDQFFATEARYIQSISIGDKYIFIDPDFVDHVVAPDLAPRPKREIPAHPHVCNCGSACIVLASSVECTNPKCRWFKEERA